MLSALDIPSSLSRSCCGNRIEHAKTLVLQPHTHTGPKHPHCSNHGKHNAAVIVVAEDNGHHPITEITSLSLDSNLHASLQYHPKRFFNGGSTIVSSSSTSSSAFSAASGSSIASSNGGGPRHEGSPGGTNLERMQIMTEKDQKKCGLLYWTIIIGAGAVRAGVHFVAIRRFLPATIYHHCDDDGQGQNAHDSHHDSSNRPRSDRCCLVFLVLVRIRSCKRKDWFPTGKHLLKSLPDGWRRRCAFFICVVHPPLNSDAEFVEDSPNCRPCRSNGIARTLIKAARNSIPKVKRSDRGDIMTKRISKMQYRFQSRTTKPTRRTTKPRQLNERVAAGMLLGCSKSSTCEHAPPQCSSGCSAGWPLAHFSPLVGLLALVGQRRIASVSSSASIWQRNDSSCLEGCL